MKLSSPFILYLAFQSWLKRCNWWVGMRIETRWEMEKNHKIMYKKGIKMLIKVRFHWNQIIINKKKGCSRVKGQILAHLIKELTDLNSNFKKKIQLNSIKNINKNSNHG